MNRAAAIFLRECAALFLTPLAWSCAALVALVGALAFVRSTFDEGAAASLGPMMSALSWALLAVAPALGVRSSTEERRTRFWEVLMASPVRPAEATCGRLAALGLAVALLVGAPTLVCAVALEFVSRPDWGEMACGALGLWLLGMGFAATGLAVGSLSESPTIAYLCSVFGWLVLTAAVALAPGALEGRWIAVAFALDPMRHLGRFLVGLLDTADVAYFVALIALLGSAAAAAVASEAERTCQAASQRIWAWVRPTLFLLAMAVLATAIGGLARSTPLRAAADVTGSRRYQLTDATQALLGRLQGDWSATLIVDRGAADEMALAQMEEVLSQAAAGVAAPAQLRVKVLDPVDGRGGGAYRSWLDELRQRHRRELDQYDATIDDALDVFAELVSTGRAQLPALDALSATLPRDSSERQQVDALRGGFRQLATSSAEVVRSITELRQSSPDRPLGDEAAAAAALRDNHRHWAAQLAGMAEWFNRHAEPEMMSAAQLARELEAIAARLRSSEDALSRLAPLELAQVGAAVAAGDALVIESPGALAVIPGWQALPRAGAEEEGSAFDRRFRSEQVLTAAIRSLAGGGAFRVVIMHSQDRSLFAPSSDGVDLAGVIDTLRAARIPVVEWRMGADAPALSALPAVFVVLPPTQARLEPTRPEQQLIDEARRLVDFGESVLLSVGPSLLPMTGRVDPWGDIAARAGVAARTNLLLTDEIPVSAGRIRRQSSLVRPIPDSCAIAQAIFGQRFELGSGVPLQISADAQAAGSVQPILESPPAPGRVLISDWRRLADDRSTARSEPIAEPVMLAAAALRQRLDGQLARAVVVGSADWAFSNMASRTQTISGRETLAAPGNRELMLAAVRWLAGQDDQVAFGGTGGEVARVGALRGSTRQLWAFALIVLVPVSLGVTGWRIRWRRHNP